MVRLRLQIFFEEGNKIVSIPLWCDCDFFECYHSCIGCYCFNPTMVRLRPNRDNKEGFPRPCFNPTMVRLRPEIPPKHIRALISFNPTMVRLRLYQKPLSVTVSPAFQSHYGAIATRFLRWSVWAISSVSIPLWCDCDSTKI